MGKPSFKTRKRIDSLKRMMQKYIEMAESREATGDEDDRKLARNHRMAARRCADRITELES